MVRDPSSSSGHSYAVDSTKLNATLTERFVQLGPDSASTAFEQAARCRPHSRTRTWLHRALRGFFSDYDVNGVLEMYPMHLLSTVQWEALLRGVPRGGLLDVGAGDGGLTRHLTPLFSSTTTTESSWAMAKRLRRAGYECIEGDIGLLDHRRTYDCVSCLNVLDRTEFPVRLLNAMNPLIHVGGALIVANPLPLDPFYYRGPSTRIPKQRLHAPGPTWERAVAQLVRAVESALPGLHLHAWTRAPYLSWGDANQPLYQLDDFVGVWCKSPDGPTRSGSGDARCKVA